MRTAPKHKNIQQFLRHDDYFRIDTGIGRRPIISRTDGLWEGYFRARMFLGGQEVIGILGVSLWESASSTCRPTRDFTKSETRSGSGSPPVTRASDGGALLAGGMSRLPGDHSV